MSLYSCCYAECHYTECCYAECHYTECHYAECHYAECPYADSHYAECHYAECRYADCHSAECHGANLWLIKCEFTALACFLSNFTWILWLALNSCKSLEKPKMPLFLHFITNFKDFCMELDLVLPQNCLMYVFYSITSNY